MNDFLFKTRPFKHQLDEFELTRDREYYGHLFEMGCGKSKVVVDTSAYQYANGMIDAVLIVAPNGVTNVWPGQYEDHCPDYIDYRVAIWRASPSTKEEEKLKCAIDHPGLKIIVMNIEAFSISKGIDFAKKLLNCFRTLMILDESSTIKSPKAIRTKNLLKLSVHAKYRRILTGTPITQGPLDLYTQFGFLDSTILRCASYFAFRNTYATIEKMNFGGARFDKVTGYQHIDKLTELIAPHSTRITKSECLDLPEKLYSKRFVALSITQRKLYNQMKKEVVAELNGMTMTAPLALTRMMRMQQIVGGFFSPDHDIEDNDYNVEPQAIDEVNLRIEALIELLEESSGKVIIWARFRSEIRAICSAINVAFGSRSAVEYHGGVDNQTRIDNIRRFQNEGDCCFFVGHVQAGGKGITLTAATTVIYYSNDFSLENRLQSEDRAHRIGQKNKVTYIDMIATDTLDIKVVTALREKKNIADLITGDDVSAWI